MKNIDLNRSEVEERSKKNIEDLSVSGWRFTNILSQNASEKELMEYFKEIRKKYIIDDYDNIADYYYDDIVDYYI